MKKSNKKSLFFYTIIILFLLCCGTVFAEIIKEEVLETRWGISFDELKTQIPSDTSTETFTPVTRANYKNRVISFIRGINSACENHMLVYRTHTTPVRDYLLIKHKLYSTMEDWGEIEPGQEKKLIESLTGLYGPPSIKNDGNLNVYSFGKKRTVAILYSLKLNESTHKCKIYFYTKDVFLLLLNEKFD